jgi:LysR family transcriptional regulator, nod-box dependent transcriptional activator
MQLKGLDLNLIVVLDALLTEKNITHAGDKIYLSQSATSGALARLRYFFGDQILVPSGNKMVLTPFAETLVGPVREILTATQGLVGRTAAFDPATSTRAFVLNLSDISATVFLTNSFRHIRELAPHIHLEIVTRHSVPEIIEQGEVDFMEVPDVLVSSLHPADELFVDSYVCIASSRNRLVRRDGLSLEQFLSIGHVTTRLRRKEHLGEVLLADTNVRPRFELIVPVFGLVPQAVVESDLIAIMNRRLADYYAKHLPLRVLELPLEIKPVKMMLQWNKHRNNDAGIQWLRRILVETIRGRAT